MGRYSESASCYVGTAESRREWDGLPATCPGLPFFPGARTRWRRKQGGVQCLPPDGSRLQPRPAELPSPGPLPVPHLHGDVANMAEHGRLIFTAKPPECFPISANGNAIFPVAQTKIWESSLIPQPTSHPSHLVGSTFKRPRIWMFYPLPPPPAWPKHHHSFSRQLHCLLTGPPPSPLLSNPLPPQHRSIKVPQKPMS